MAKATKTKKKGVVKSVDQLTFARAISQKLNLRISDVIAVVEEEQKLTMEYVRMGYKVIKKNYLTLEGKKYAPKPNWRCPLNGKVYDLSNRVRVVVRVGEGFKSYLAGEEKRMPEKLCRFVESAPQTA